MSPSVTEGIRSRPHGDRSGEKPGATAREPARADDDHDPPDHHHERVQREPDETRSPREDPLDAAALSEDEVDTVGGRVRADVQAGENACDAVHAVLAGGERKVVLPGQVADGGHEQYGQDSAIQLEAFTQRAFLSFQAPAQKV